MFVILSTDKRPEGRTDNTLDFGASIDARRQALYQWWWTASLFDCLPGMTDFAQTKQGSPTELR
jgi:hypothetical protein